MAKFGDHVSRRLASSLLNVIRQADRQADKNFSLGDFLELSIKLFSCFKRYVTLSHLRSKEFQRMHKPCIVIGRHFNILAILKAGKRLPKGKFSLLVIHKRFSTFLIKDHAHVTDIAYKPFYKKVTYLGL